MSGECHECGEHALECRCKATRYIKQMERYGILDYTMNPKDPYCSLGSKKVDDYLQEALKCMNP